MARSRIDWDDNTLTARLEEFPARVERFVSSVMDYHSLRGEAYMKKNAPWIDRTGNARGSLHTRVEKGLNSQTLVLAHGMPYGIWLEVRWAGRYSIVRPTLPTLGRDVMQTFRKGLGRL